MTNVTISLIRLTPYSLICNSNNLQNEMFPFTNFKIALIACFKNNTEGAYLMICKEGLNDAVVYSNLLLMYCMQFAFVEY